MRRHTTWSMRLLLACVLGAGLSSAIAAQDTPAAPAGPASPGADSELVLGLISDDPKLHYVRIKPLLDYVVPRMAGVGIRSGRVLMARDAQQMQSYLRRGRVDWVSETSASAGLLQHRAGAEPILVTERDGVSAYHTVYFARADSPVQSLQQLQGRSIAFQNRTSTSAYFMPVLELLERRMSLEILLSPKDRPAPGSVGYLFARSELNLSSWVHKGLVDAGAMSNLDWDNPKRVPPSYRQDLRVFAQSKPFPRAVELVRGDMDPAVRERLRQVLLGASEDPDAREAMLLFFRTTRFLPIDAQSAQALEQLRKGVARVIAEVE